jgi:ATP-binding cassette subfamily C protein CydC
MNVYVKGTLGILLGFLTIGMGAGLLASASYLISLSALMPNIGVLTLPIVAVRFFGIGRAVCRYGERYLTHAATFAILSRIRPNLYNPTK